METILITGGAGNLGGSLARRLVAEGNYYVIIVDNLSTGNTDKLPSGNTKRWCFINADVNSWADISPVFGSNGIDYVFHYAAVVGVQRTLANPIKVLEDIEGIKHILSLSKDSGVKKVFFASSSEVYGEPVEIPQVEDTTPLNSRLPYSIVKNAGEAYCKSYQQEFGLEFTIFRFFNTYGPLQSTDFVIAQFIQKALLNRDISIHGDGRQTRTFCYVDDNIDATIKILKNNLATNDVLNIGSEREITITELAQTIINLLDSTSEIVYTDPLKKGDTTRRQPSIEKMKAVLDGRMVSLEEGIMKTANYIQQNLPHP